MNTQTTITNGSFTVFGLMPGEKLDDLIVETDDEATYERAINWARDNGVKITRVYKPDTILDTPDFLAALSC